MISFALAMAAAIYSHPAHAEESANAKESVDLVIGLKERIPLATLAENATRFGTTYTPEQIRAAAAPSTRDYENALTSLRDAGFTIVKETRSHLFVTVRANSSTIENAFQTRFSTSGGVRRSSFAYVPRNLAFVKTIVGLDTSNKRKPHYKVAETQERIESIAADAGRFSVRARKTAAQPGILPGKIRASYGFDPIYASGITGKGQSIAIATYDGLKVSEITAYFTKIGLKTKRKVDVVSFNGTAPYNAGSAMETELDAEFSGMIATGSDIHIFASAENSDSGELSMFTAILDDNRAKVVNYSWGSCEKNLSPDHRTAMDTVFAQAVAQGVNIFVASGDSGSDGCNDGSVTADYPASHPNVVAVGGTALTPGSGSGSASETAWTGSGGGVSSLYSLPKYQTSFPSPYTKRSIPDVAFNADPATGEAAWVTNEGAPKKGAAWIVLGGTSIAAPQWAGFLALVGEANAKKGVKSPGFLNPILYSLTSSERTAYLSDVTSGSNGAFKAGAGWDAVTGYGSMRANALFSKLTGATR